MPHETATYLSSAATLVVGLGATGLAVARWCQRAGARIRIADTRAQPPALQQARAELRETTDYRLGLERFEAALLDGMDQIVMSPGLSLQAPELVDLLAAAATRNVPVLGEIELFAQALKALSAADYHPKVLAVTGTNGKTTVTALTAHLLRACGYRAQAAGNIAPAALDALAAALETQQLPDVWVLELSSFQLELTSTLRPQAAVVLNLTEDHLDWHGSMSAYAAAKARIFQGATIRIVNRDDARVRAMVTSLEHSDVRSFGQDLPRLTHDLGLDLTTGLAWLVESAESGAVEPRARRKKNEPEPGRSEGRLNRLMPADALLLRGKHNWLNAQAALLLARSLGVPWAGLLRAVREYRGEPHRVSWVRSVMGVDFIDDSKGTNVGATIAALEGLGQRVVLIAGGDGKGQDFRPLASPVARHARAVVLLGRDAGRLAAALADTEVPCELAADLPTAVAQAFELAQPGDAVLLSPACASLDMFRDYHHRAEVFAAAVADLALARGEV